MPTYTAPGVYVEEVKGGSRPIAGVGTSTAAIIGTVANGVTMPEKPDGSGNYTKAPVDEPRLVTNWTQFMNQFGDFHAGNDTLAHAVYGFLHNGGTRCYVVRTQDLEDATSVKSSLDRLQAIDEIAVVCAPGALDAAAQEVINHCETMKDRFAIVDGHEHSDSDISPDAAAIKGALQDSNYAALYFPWLKVTDPLSPGEMIDIPPSGHMAGIYARVDSERGVHKAPANTNVRGALGLQYPVSKNEQSGLNDPHGINVIRSFNGNIKVWGARTLGSDVAEGGEFKYVNVRRLFNFIRESLEEGMQFAVFEPNAQPLWMSIQRSSTAFLTNAWRDGALFGSTPEQAFYVKCDESTNDAATRALGQVVTEIGLAMVRPAEFVIFRISQVTGG